MKNLKCLIFDMDGTLTQTNQLIFDSFNYIAGKYTGRTFSQSEIAAMFGPPEEGALLSIVSQKDIEAVMADYLSFYRSNHQRLARLYPGVKEILAYMKERGKILALFTGKGIHTTRITLEESGISEYFDLIVTGNDVVNHKPSAEGIYKVLSHFQLHPDEALMVGDSVSDIKASREAGVKVAAVVWDSYGKENVLAMKTDFLFHNVDEFFSFLKGNLD
ncbi:MAG: HAD-IA family hydrolase [bacterium]